jgi:purine-nucleoside phosphorylase
MSFPNYPDKHSLASLLNPEDIVSYRRRLGRLPSIKFPEGILFCLERGMPRRMRRRAPVRKVGSMLGDLYQVRNSQERVGVMTDFGGGAPIVAELAEELIALGASRLLLMTWGGALQPGLSPGDIVVCNRAVRDEGTSHHYLPPGKFVEASPELVERFAAAILARGGQGAVGPTWTTDAPYRETASEVIWYQAEGVMTVEMEIAGLYAVSQVRNVQAAAAVVIMDSLADLRWTVPADLGRIYLGLETVYLAGIDALNP